MSSEIHFDTVGADTIDRVVELDSVINGSRRHDFFAKRFQAQEQHPEAFVSIGASRDGDLAGFVCCHLLKGEFGSSEIIAVLDAISVDPACQGQGIGRELIQRLKDEIESRGGQEIRTQAGWNQPGVSDFFSRAGFHLAPRLIVERSTRDVNF